MPCSELHAPRASAGGTILQNSEGVISILFPFCSRADCARSPERRPEDFPLVCVAGCSPLQWEDLKNNFQPCARCCPEAAGPELLELLGTEQHCCRLCFSSQFLGAASPCLFTNFPGAALRYFRKLLFVIDICISVLW